jgi:hypothetical protein
VTLLLGKGLFPNPTDRNAPAEQKNEALLPIAEGMLDTVGKIGQVEEASPDLSKGHGSAWRWHQLTDSRYC